MIEEEDAESLYCLPTDSAVKLLKDGTSMPDVVAQLGESAWHTVPLSELGALSSEELGKIKHLAGNWSAVVQNYLVGLEDTHGAGGKSV